MELLGDVGRVKPCFGLFGDSVRVGARWIHSLHQRIIASEIVLNASDGTPR
jgi:hypothetical protein